MGGSVSADSFSTLNKENDDFEAYMSKIVPDYYVRNIEVSQKEIDLAQKSWNMVVSGAVSSAFREHKENNPIDFKHENLLMWFSEVFYSRFFDLCPEAKQMFDPVNILVQGRLIAAVISSALDSLNDPIKLKNRMEYTTYKHFERGVRAAQYGKMGSALVSSLELILGPDFDDATKSAWYNIYSSMLDIILPMAVKHEIEKMKNRVEIMDSVFVPYVPSPLTSEQLNALQLRNGNGDGWSDSIKRFDKLFLPKIKSQSISERCDNTNQEAADHQDFYDGQLGEGVKGRMGSYMEYTPLLSESSTPLESLPTTPLSTETTTETPEDIMVTKSLDLPEGGPLSSPSERRRSRKGEVRRHSRGTTKSKGEFNIKADSDEEGSPPGLMMFAQFLLKEPSNKNLKSDHSVALLTVVEESEAVESEEL